MSKKKKKSAREKRVLVGALLVAAVITAGSTFAWFTSKDEVTNRLSASAKYDVSIAEDFQPPEEWIPGQTINKDVSAVNTGNVDAFVRMWLGGQMRLLNETTSTAMVEATSANVTGLTAVTDADKLNLGLTWEKTASGSSPVYYRTLSTTQRKNPDLNNTSNDEETNQPATFSEVQSVQAGGVLVMAPENAGYSWTLEQATTMSVNGSTVTDLAKGTVVGTGNSSATGATKITAANTNYYGSIDASTFKPETEGLYIFRRNVGETADGTANTYEYSGYYYVPAKAASETAPAVAEQYFALHTGTGANGNSDYVLPSGVINDNSTAVPSNDQVLPVSIATGQKVYLYTAAEQVIETGTAATNLQWTYHAPDATKTTDLEKNGYFTVKYVGADGTSGTTAGDTADDIVIDVALANIGTTSETWTAIGADTYMKTFYYNNDVEAGDTTTKLVDSVKLADATTQKAYLAFDFDLDVFLESVQVTMDDAGKEKTTPVNTWGATEEGTSTPVAINTGAKPSSGDNAATYNTTNASEIDVVGWGALS